MPKAGFELSVRLQAELHNKRKIVNELKALGKDVKVRVDFDNAVFAKFGLVRKEILAIGRLTKGINFGNPVAAMTSGLWWQGPDSINHILRKTQRAK
jgi:hypothetical protein